MIRRGGFEEQVHEAEIALSMARGYLDGDVVELQDFADALDAAQGQVHSGEQEFAYVILKIVKDEVILERQTK